MQKVTIQEAECLLQEITNEEDERFQMLTKDERKGVQKLILKWYKQKELAQKEKEKFLEMSKYEKALREKGLAYIAGIDEVGRGPLAGPVVTAAVVLPEDFYIPGLNDSKKLSEAKRERFYDEINAKAIAIGVGIISPQVIDEINIYQATKRAMLDAIANLSCTPEHLLIDAMKLPSPIPQTSIVKGDTKSISISAASIIAKVTRDRMMKELGKEHPEYGFEQHMGYGTKQHLQAIETYGVLEEHRKTFAPIKDMI
ncbi:ribonuclease HII [Bacillus cereus]|uniref:Ribonuclease HII n=1 Tax=Bacillus cereus TaxID=1396 RepID=A0AA44QDL0_BACCE|nr:MULTISPECIES: ribonuclease HII [Bacillus cereus group]PFA23942.1 ribonuclease HII [Bacillus cereus]PFN08102.1 ribonuclease HII [Bacillus cereus]PFO85248.1 ribonuclease HII [Bacillus cereus]PFS05905.1 ribonuclease HII [Bacillus cereus]PGZ20396.1 ribonuclease HII [Bacillus cereus]